MADVGGAERGQDAIGFHGLNLLVASGSQLVSAAPASTSASATIWMADTIGLGKFAIGGAHQIA